MLSLECVRELRSSWLPHITDSGLDRLITLLEKRSPLLIHGCFTKTMPMGCLASHAAWHHPETAQLHHEAGISWLHRVAGLNPATSQVIREWDRCGNEDWEVRQELAALFRAEREARRSGVCESSPQRELAEV
jgi:hypothetical protein